MKSPAKEDIRKLRMKYSMTQVACAEKVGVGGRQWRRFESGKSKMSVLVWHVFRNKKFWLKS